MNILIKNVKLVDYNLNFKGDILIKEGIISKIGENIDEEGIETIDGKGKTLMPSFVDTHAHFREPGYEYKEDIETGSKAALKGGYTGVLLMGNTNPPASSKKVIEHVLDKSRKLDLIDIYQAGTITENLDGQTLSHLDEINDLVGVITDDGKGVKSSKVLYDAMIYAKEKELLIMSHAEDPDFTDSDMRLAEDMMTYRDIELAKITGAKIHFAHVSTKEAADRIIKEKKSYPNISFEVTPHHIFSYDNIDYRVNPPLRKKEDRDYLIECIRKGEVDCIGTDHAPHSKKDKEMGAPGISGIEVGFQLLYTKLVKEENIPLERLSQIMSKNTADLLGIKKGRLEVGYQGDLVLIDEDREEVLNPATFVSKGKNNPFKGEKLYGKIISTIRKGKIMFGEEN
ncbi:MAG: dihydroorotase [Tissierellales bacterium]|nr:dihydroorotase [Tissierellales bacterium]